VRYGFFSDAHGDFDAVEASVEALHDTEEILFLGDCAGERDSERCIQYLRSHGIMAVTGNHDRWVFETQSLSEGTLTYLQDLPLSLERENFLALHSDYEEKGGECFFQYVQSTHECEIAFSRHPHRLIFMGHTHLACINDLRDGKIVYEPVKSSTVKTLENGFRYLINVGMARDCVTVYDSCADTVEFRFHRPAGGRSDAPKEKGFFRRLFGLLSE